MEISIVTANITVCLDSPIMLIRDNVDDTVGINWLQTANVLIDWPSPALFSTKRGCNFYAIWQLV